MKAQIIKTGLVIVFSVFIFSACKKDKGESNEEEVITTMILNFNPVGGTPLEFTFDDADGPGGSAPTIDDIELAVNKTYEVTVTLLNALANPPEDITEEVDEENQAHRFYYEPSAGSNISVSNLDNDVDGVPLGIVGTWTTTAAANGTITITLRHYPGNPPDKQTADPVNSPKSSTDITVTFNTQLN